MDEVLKAGDKVVMNRDCDFFKHEGFEESSWGWWREMEEEEFLVISHINTVDNILNFENIEYSADYSWVKKIGR